MNGVSVSIEASVEELRAKGHSVHVFTSRNSGYRDGDSNIWRFPAVKLPLFPQYPLAVPPFFGGLRHFRAQQFDIVHTHTPYTIGFVGLRWAESNAIPIVSTYHTLYERYAHYVPYFPRAYVRYKIAKHTNYYYNRVSEVITPSEAAFASLRRQSVMRPITVIPTGNPQVRAVDRDEARRFIGARGDEYVLLYVGRMAKEKNIILLLDAIAEVFRNRNDARLWMVGDGPDRAAAQSHARAIGIGDKVKCVGAVPRADVDQYYAAADLFVFASTTETQGLVIGEAMTFGLPSVVVRGGGASDSTINGETGVIVGSSVLEISHAVINLLERPEYLQRLGNRCREVGGSWTHSASCDKLLEVYHRAMRKEEEQVAVYSTAN